MNIAVAAILWYLIGYVGCVRAWSRKFDVTLEDMILFLLAAVLGPTIPAIICASYFDYNKVVIRRRK